MKLWIDDVRPAPTLLGWAALTSVNNAKWYIEYLENESIEIELIDIDHDSGIYFYQGGDYIKLLDWLEETGRKYPIRIHSMNPVGVERMRAIIERNGWTEVR